MKSIPSTRHLYLGTDTLRGVEKSGGFASSFFTVGQVNQEFTFAF